MAEKKEYRIKIQGQLVPVTEEVLFSILPHETS
jgi:hypothetical protein